MITNGRHRPPPTAGVAAGVKDAVEADVAAPGSTIRRGIARAAEGTPLRSSLGTETAEYRANREAQLVLLRQLDEQLDLARAGGGPRYADRHHARGRLLARERIEVLLDRDAYFLELSPLA